MDSILPLVGDILFAGGIDPKIVHIELLQTNWALESMQKNQHQELYRFGVALILSFQLMI
jgi:hypothetical protein